MTRTVAFIVIVAMLVSPMGAVAVAAPSPPDEIEPPSVAQIVISAGVVYLLYKWVSGSIAKGQEAKAAKAEQERLDEIARRQAYVDANPDLDPKHAEAVLGGSIMMGMPASAVEIVLGKPDRNNRSVGAFGVHEQWIYGTWMYVYLQNGFVTGWQN